MTPREVQPAPAVALASSDGPEPSGGPEPSDGRHRYRTRVQWVDTDASGRIHFTAAFRWAEAAEHDLLRRTGHSFHGGFPRVDAQATYLGRLGFGDEVEVELGAERVGRTSIGYRWVIWRDGVACVRGRHVAVYVPDGEHAAELPAALRATLAAVSWEGTDDAVGDGRSG